MTIDPRKALSELKRFSKHSNLNQEIMDRLRVLIEYYKGSSTKQLAEECYLSQRTIQRWIKDYSQNGLDALNATEFKPKKLTDDILNSLIEAMANNPLEYGLPYSSWDGFTLSVYVKQTYQQDISPFTFQKILHSARNQYADDFSDGKHMNVYYVSNIIREYKEERQKALALMGLIFLGRTDKNKRLASPRRKESGTKLFRLTVNKNAAKKYIRYYGFVCKLYHKGQSKLFKNTIQTKEIRLMSCDIYKLLKSFTEKTLRRTQKNLVVMRDSKQNRLAIQQLYTESVLLTASSKISFLLIPKTAFDYSDINEVQFIKDITDGIDYKEQKNHNRIDDDPGYKLRFSGLEIRTVTKRFKVLTKRKTT